MGNPFIAPILKAVPGLTLLTDKTSKSTGDRRLIESAISGLRYRDSLPKTTRRGKARLPLLHPDAPIEGGMRFRLKDSFYESFKYVEQYLGLEHKDNPPLAYMERVFFQLANRMQNHLNLEFWGGYLFNHRNPHLYLPGANLCYEDHYEGTVDLFLCDWLDFMINWCEGCDALENLPLIDVDTLSNIFQHYFEKSPAPVFDAIELSSRWGVIYEECLLKVGITAAQIEWENLDEEFAYDGLIINSVKTIELWSEFIPRWHTELYDDPIWREIIEGEIILKALDEALAFSYETDPSFRKLIPPYWRPMRDNSSRNDRTKTTRSNYYLRGRYRFKRV